MNEGLAIDTGGLVTTLQKNLVMTCQGDDEMSV